MSSLMWIQHYREGREGIPDIVSKMQIFTYIEVPGCGFVSKGEKDPFPDPPGSHFKVIFVILCKKQTYEYIH